MIFRGLVLSFLIFPQAGEALRRCSRFQTDFRVALEDVTGKACDDIEEEDLENLEALNLAELGLSDFNSAERDVFEWLQDLRSLDLSDNQLSHLPEEIKHMDDLEEMDISGNPINRFPSGLIGDLDDLKRLDYSQTGIPLSSDREHGVVITSGDLYTTGTSAKWFDCFFFPCWKNHAYIRANGNHWFFDKCKGDDPGDECHIIARRWDEYLQKGNRLLFTTSGQYVKAFTVLTGKAKSSSSPERRLITSSLTSAPPCPGVDGFPFSSYGECRWQSGVEKCFANHQGGIDYCLRRLEGGKQVFWRSGEDCSPSMVCPKNWNQEWYLNDGSIKPTVTVISNYY